MHDAVKGTVDRADTAHAGVFWAGVRPHHPDRPAMPEYFALQGVLLYGPPGTGKTLLARALACNINATFIKVVASAIVDKYIGESSRMIREMFGYAVSPLRRTRKPARVDVTRQVRACVWNTSKLIIHSTHALTLSECIY